MRQIPGQHWEVWRSGQFVGNDRPVTRATLQRSVVQPESYGAWRTLIFNQTTTEQLEIPNIKTVTIDRRNGADAAEMVMVIANNVPLSTSDNLDLTHAGLSPSDTSGPSVRQLKDLGYPGYYTYNRGMTPVSTARWGHDISYNWMDAFIPNRVIRTWQGYGTDGAANPWSDTNLTLTGTWLIDTVHYSTNGTITIKCRDLAKLLIDQRLYPPIVPAEHYPVKLWADHTESVYTTTTETITTETSVPGGIVEGANVAVFPNWEYNSSSAYYYADKIRGGSCGHGPQYAFDNDITTYWLSISNGSQTADWSYEWIEADTRGNPIKRVKFHQKIGGGYVLYVSVMVGGVWQGTSTIPYDAGTVGAPNGSDIKYVHTSTTAAEAGWVSVDLPDTYYADRIRLTFHNLTSTSTCYTPFTYNYRVAISEIRAMALTETAPTTVITEEEVTTGGYVDEFVEGNIRDYTDIVKLFAGWAGFFWPTTDYDVDWVVEKWSGYTYGRIWGDFEYTGAYPVEPPEIDASYWDNKSVMDAINQLREIVGFVFYVDATGGVVWRSPNIWKKGNFVSGIGYIDGDDTIETVDEDSVLIDYGVTLSDDSLRSEIVIVGSDPGTDLWLSVRPGYAVGESVPEAGYMSDARLLGGQERVTVIPDYPFQEAAELQKFGYLLSLWMHWTFRKSSFRIPGNAAFEPDDQIRIYERTTSEAFVHYIESVKSSMDIDKGTWYLDIDTHWLGEGPEDTWVIDYSDMAGNSPALYATLVALGRIAEDETSVPVPTDAPTYTTPEFYWPRPDVASELFPDPPAILDADDAYEAESGPLVDLGGSSNYGDGQRGTSSWTSGHWGTSCSGSCKLTTRLISAGDHAYQTISQNIQTNAVLIDANVWVGFREVLKDLGITIVSSTHCFRCSTVVGTSKTSNHAYGIAIDVNPRLNDGWGVFYRSGGAWYRSKDESGTYSGYVGASPPAPDADAQALHNSLSSRLKCNNIPVFRWGGNWNTLKDYMHYEVIVTPNEIRNYGVKLDGVLIGGGRGVE